MDQDRVRDLESQVQQLTTDLQRSDAQARHLDERLVAAELVIAAIIEGAGAEGRVSPAIEDLIKRWTRHEGDEGERVAHLALDLLRP